MQEVSGLKGGLFVCFSDRPCSAAQEPELCGDSLDWQLTLPPLPSWLEGQRLWWLSKQRNVRVQTLSERPSFHSPFLPLSSLVFFSETIFKAVLCSLKPPCASGRRESSHSNSVDLMRLLSPVGESYIYLSAQLKYITQRYQARWHTYTHTHAHKGLADKGVWALCICWRQQ